MSRNNAGKFSHGQLALSEDGVEMTFATNYLGTITSLIDLQVERAFLPFFFLSSAACFS